MRRLRISWTDGGAVGATITIRDADSGELPDIKRVEPGPLTPETDRWLARAWFLKRDPDGFLVRDDEGKVVQVEEQVELLLGT